MPDDIADALGCTDLTVEFHPRGRTEPVRALQGVTVEVRAGQVLGVVGESGSGKSTLARCLVGLQRPTSGELYCGDIDITRVRGRRERARLGAQVAMVFQDPRSSLNPRMQVGTAIADPLVVHHRGTAADRSARVSQLLDDVGLPSGVATRRVRELSGGQLQRVAIARALALSPRFVVADEPTSALDVSVQAQILNLLGDLRESYGFGMLMISHDLRVMRAVSNEVLVMLNGEIVERGPTSEIFTNPQTDYARQLVSATPLLTQ